MLSLRQVCEEFFGPTPDPAHLVRVFDMACDPESVERYPRPTEEDWCWLGQYIGRSEPTGWVPSDENGDPY